MVRRLHHHYFGSARLRCTVAVGLNIFRADMHCHHWRGMEEGGNCSQSQSTCLREAFPPQPRPPPSVCAPDTPFSSSTRPRARARTHTHEHASTRTLGRALAAGSFGRAGQRGAASKDLCAGARTGQVVEVEPAPAATGHVRVLPQLAPCSQANMARISASQAGQHSTSSQCSRLLEAQSSP